MRMHDSEHLYLGIERYKRYKFFFCVQQSKLWMFSLLTATHKIDFTNVHSVTNSCFHNHKDTLPLFLCLPPVLSPSLYNSLPLSLSLYDTDTNIPKCGLTANATTHFLFNLLQPVAQWHKQRLKTWPSWGRHYLVPRCPKNLHRLCLVL